VARPPAVVNGRHAEEAAVVGGRHATRPAGGATAGLTGRAAPPTIVAMSFSTQLDGPRLGPATRGAPDCVVVLLHGLGADGQDLIGLAPHLRDALPTAQFVAPDAPFPCDMAPFGRQWFSLQDRSPERMLAGVRAAAPILDAFLDEVLEEYRVPAERLALVGFSQGTMMSLHVAPRRLSQIAGAVGFSGALVGGEALAAEIETTPPVLLVHGDADEIVPVQASEAAAVGLDGLGVPVRLLVRPGLGHSIDQRGLVEATAFLKAALPPL